MKNTSEYIAAQIRESARVKEALLKDRDAMETLAGVAGLLVSTYRQGHKTFWAGNGGSAADAQHMAAELVNKFRLNRRGLPAIALTTDTSVLTAIGNDYGFDQIFVRQLDALASPGDVLVAISTSGESANLVKAVGKSREMGVVSVALVGARPCALDACDHVIHIPSEETPRIQECQTLIGHILCDMVEQALFNI